MMLFNDHRFSEFSKRVRNELAQWEFADVLDLCCGFGRFAPCFKSNLYTGIDFSDEMIKLANERQSNYFFKNADIKSLIPERKYDVIFEVNSLHSLGLSAAEFVERFRPYATRAIVCLEADRFFIEQIYP